MAAMENVQDDGENDNRSKYQNRPIHVHEGWVVGGREEGENNGKAQPKKSENVDGQSKSTKCEA